MAKAYSRIREPLASFSKACESGAIPVHYFRLALDALTLAEEILAAAVIEADADGRLFGGAVTRTLKAE
jgi:hypothetical protein